MHLIFNKASAYKGVRTLTFRYIAHSLYTSKDQELLSSMHNVDEIWKYPSWLDKYKSRARVAGLFIYLFIFLSII